MEVQLITHKNELGKFKDLLSNQKLIKFLELLKNSFEEYIYNYIDNCISERFNEHNHSIKIKKEDSYLTTKKACEILSVSDTSLWRLVKKGVITKYYLLNKPRYKKSEILKLFKEFEIKK